MFLDLLHRESFDAVIVDFYHPDTYLNKILIAFADGALILFNLKSKKAVHKFEEFIGQTLTSISGSPDPDIAAIGFLSGTVTFFELKKAQSLFSLKIDGAVTSLAFRTDEMAHFAVGSARGEVYIFDLDSRKLEHIIPMHAKSVSSLWFVPQQPLLISSSGDNSIKEHLFESSEYRCLRQRSGHYKSPNLIRFIGDDAKFLISAGSDRSLRFFSSLKDNQNFEFSQGSTQKNASKLKLSEEDLKLPQINHLDIFETKTLKWDNILTSHLGQSFAKSWRLDRKVIGQNCLETSDKSPISHISISSCGNYGLLSSTSGNIDIFNIQSGIRRKTMNAFSNCSVLASFTDSTNSIIISLSKDGFIKLFDFSKNSLLNEFNVDSKIIKASINKDTELIALACEDNIIRVVDYSALRIVRLFSGHVAPITDMIFSSNSKWLISCSKDKTIRTWDLPSGALTDSFEVDQVPKALALSKNMEFLASCHENEISIKLWSNRSLYSGDCNVIESAISWTQSNTTSSGFDEVCCSSFPSSRWKNIYFLEKIRSNTKSIAMPSTKKNSLPFFLAQAMEQEKSETVVELDVNAESRTSSEEFCDLFSEYKNENNYDGFIEYLKNIQPSKLDFEISCLSQESKLESIKFILKSISLALKKGQSFELIHAILSLTLRHHEIFICSNGATFSEIMNEISGCVKDKWVPIEALMQSSICLISFAREQ